MQEATVFVCPTPGCDNSLASDLLNRVQLQVLRRWQKTCPRCKKLAMWVEQIPLLDTAETNQETYGGSNDENTTQETNSNIPKPSRKRRPPPGINGH